ncbi:hypothetical protein PILCRDRAFT_57220, partial [Piloderma croceum F 1598]
SNGRQTVGDGAFFTDVPSVLAVCHLEGNDDMYYYSTTFSGGPGVKGRQTVRNVSSAHHLATPPLTPDSGADVEGISGNDGKRSNDALDFLLTIFPRDGLVALPYAKSVAIAAPNMGATFDGVVLQMPGKPKVLYVDGKTAQSVSLRESIVALLDLADECFQCSALVIALDKSSPALGDILHSFMYVGGNIVTKPPFQVDPAYLLVGMEI